MKKIEYNTSCGIEKFLFQYEKDLKNIYKSLENEKLIDLVDIVDIESLKIINDRKERLGESFINGLKNEEYAIALIIGGVCDDNVTFFRAIDGKQYRIADGECYEETSENFHDYEVVEELIYTGDMKFIIESSYCLLVYVLKDKLNFVLVEINDYNNENKCDVVNNSGKLGNIIESYIKKIINKQ